MLSIIVSLLPLWLSLAMKSFYYFKNKTLEGFDLQYKTFVSILPYWWLVGIMTMASTVQTTFMEPHIMGYGINGTKLIYDIEGDFISVFQKLSTPLLDTVFSVVYTIGYSQILLIPLFIASVKGDKENAKLLSYGMALLYITALPFYIFFPVFEPWVFNPEYGLEYFHMAGMQELGIRGILHMEFMPISSVEGSVVHSISGINNCFPSLHTSVSFLLILIFSKEMKGNFSIPFIILGTMIIFSTMYLGIHWVIDVAAGIVQAVICYWLAKVLMKKTDMLPPFVPSKIS